MFKPLLLESGLDSRFLLETGDDLLLEDSTGEEPAAATREIRVLNSQYAERRSSRDRRHRTGTAMQRREE